MSANATVLDRIVFNPVLCEGWKAYMEGAAYHLANFFLLLGFMGGSGIIGSVYIFGFLVIGFICSALWGWLDACGLDIFTWNILLVLICLLQLTHAFYQLRKDAFSKEFDQLYKQICQPLQVPLQVYKEIVKCCEEKVLPLAKDQTYALEGKTSIDRLSFLLSGRVRVSQDGQFLHYVFPYQFLDSPEWESLRPSEEGTFQIQVTEAYLFNALILSLSEPNQHAAYTGKPTGENSATLTAEEDCTFISWQRKKLYMLLAKDRYIARIFSVLLGYDIAEKLYALNEKLFAKFGLRFDIRLPSLYHVLGPASSDTEVEKEPRECEEPPVPSCHPPTFVQTAPAAPRPGSFPAHPRRSRPDSDLSGEDSTSLVLEDFAELTGSFMDYVSEGEYMK